METLKSTISWQAKQRKKRLKINLGFSAKAQQKVSHPSARQRKICMGKARHTPLGSEQGWTDFAARSYNPSQVTL